MTNDKETKKTKNANLKVASLERALSVLKVFETADNPVSLAEIASITGLYKSMILRFLLSFEGFGYIRRTDEGLYVLGPRLYRLGTKYYKQFNLDLALQSVLKQLVELGTESASFHIRDGDYRLCIARQDSYHPTLDRVKVGDMRPLSLGAAGKIILAFDEEHSDPALEDIRNNHIALSYGDIDPACWAIAAPVFVISGSLLGAISLSGPKERFTPDAIENMTKHLRQAAIDLSDQAIANNSAVTNGSYLRFQHQ